MRDVCIALLILVSLAATASAQSDAQVTAETHASRLVIQTQLAALQAAQTAMGPDDVIARLMSFDRNRDGRVALGELSERMEGLVARGDSSGDGALDASELRTLATSQSFLTRAQHGLSSYGFADTGQSSRNHIENSIDDLRLAPNARQEAKRIAVAYVSEFEGEADANLRSALAPLISADKLPALERDLKSLARLTSAMVGVRFLSASLPRMVLNRHQLSPEQLRIAETAVEAFQADQKFDEGRQLALVTRLSGYLTEEESDNLRAALARRPLARTGLSAGFQRVSGEGFTITPVVR